MKPHLSLKLFLKFLLASLLVILLVQNGNTASPIQYQRKIVLFEKNIVNERAKEELVRKFGGVKIKNLELVNGMVVILPPQAEDLLAKQKGVKKIETDLIVEALAVNKAETKKSSQTLETLPWGVDRVDAELAWKKSVGQEVNVGVLDTGIDLKHPDLTERIKKGYNAIDPSKLPVDNNGHGTHVAGIIAATDNSIGVIGVAPAANLYPIKVLNDAGTGYVSDVIEGLEWAISNNLQVVNMSFGSNSGNEALKEAISLAYQAGLVLVAAAGNNAGGSVTYPAAYPEVIAVSATDSSDNLAQFSSTGPEVDLSAPGTNILSTYKRSKYATLSGTSMAAPHASGAVAEVLATPINPLYDLNGNGYWDPQEVKSLLENTADDLGDPGFDFYFGHGLVDVEESVTGIQSSP